MENPASYVVDRSGWPSGPWDQEPDRIEWRHAGLPCLIVRSPSVGVLCGYVGVQPEHPLHGVGRDGLPYVEVDVELCYAARCAGAICHVPQPGEPDDVWWIGFDCGHAPDLMPPFAGRFARHGLVYKDVAHVTGLVNALAEQLVQVAVNAEAWAEGTAPGEIRSPEILPCDLALHVPVESDRGWAAAHQLANNERRLRGLDPADEVRVLVTAQLDARENGVWVVKGDGSRSRPVDHAEGCEVPGCARVEAGAALVDRGQGEQLERGPFFYRIDKPRP